MASKELVDLLAQLSISNLQSILENNGILTVEDAQYLTESHLAEMGCNIGQRLKLINAMKKVSNSNSNSQNLALNTTPTCICIGCPSPQYSGYQFCSRTCGSGRCGHPRNSNLSVSNVSAPNVSSPNNNNNASNSSTLCICIGCTLPQYSGYQFCSKTCGSGRCGHPRNSNLSVPNVSAPNVSSPNNNNNVSNSSKCICIGCPSPQFSGYQFCSKACGSGRCGHPRNSNLSVPNVSARNASNQLVSRADPQKYQSIAHQFQSKWSKSTTPPQIVAILKINMNSQNLQRFEQYQDSKKHVKTFGKGGVGNTHRRFHGTDLNCQIHTSLITCKDQSCKVCRILESGFLLSKQGSNTNWGRFGRGLYFTSTSGKANDYSNGRTKAMFVAHVVVGKGKKELNDQPHLQNSPNGYDSVLGEVGGSLNYDEVIVYTDDAALPLYLIVYS